VDLNPDSPEDLGQLYKASNNTVFGIHFTQEPSEDQKLNPESIIERWDNGNIMILNKSAPIGPMDISE